MSESSEENPYRPPPEVEASSPLEAGLTIHYEATPTKQDLGRALRSGPSMVWDFLLIVLFSLVISGILIAQLYDSLIQRRGPFTGASDWTCTMLLITIPAVLAGFGLYRKWFAAEIYLKNYPRALKPRTGELTAEGFRLTTDDSQSWWPHTSLLMFQQQKDQFIISYDLRGASKQILPLRGFSDPVTALKLFEHYAKQNERPPIGALDDRILKPLTTPIMLGQASEDAIEFSGTLRSADLVDTPLPAMRKHTLRKAVFVLILLHVGLVLLYWKLGVFYALLALLPLLFVDAMTWLVFHRTLRPLSNAEQPLMQISGWLDETGLTLLNNIEQSATHWSRFDEIGVDEQLVWLRFNSGSDLFLLLPQRFFKNESDWHSAQRLMRQHVDPPTEENRG